MSEDEKLYRNKEKKLKMDMDTDDNIATALTPRDYQIDFLEEAKERNVIACLGTGTGKTFIAVMLIKDMSYKIRGPYQTSKRSIFLVPTVPLVEQQASVLKTHTDLNIGSYHGSMGVDLWSPEKWSEEFENHNVLVMVAEVFRNVLQHGFVSLDRINLLVFDECHRAVKSHPYREIMRLFDNCPEADHPRVLGLTASVLNGKCRTGKVKNKIEDLEKTLRSHVRVARSITSAHEFGTKPQEILVLYGLGEELEGQAAAIASVTKLISQAQDFISLTNIQSDDEDNDTMFDPIRDCRRYISDILDIKQSMGLWSAMHAILKYVEQLDKLILRESDQENLDKLKMVRSILEKALEKLKEITAKDRPKDLVLTKIPNKLKELLKLLESQRKQRDPLCGIVFVQKRITAVMLCNWLEAVSQYQNYEFLRVSYVIGHGTVSITEGDLERSKMVYKKQEDILTKFRNNTFNLLVASSVIEEGMDVPHCNLVIRFDPPSDYRSYVQSKGRARSKISRFALFYPRLADQKQFLEDLTEYRHIEDYLLKICTDREIPDIDEINEHMADLERPPYMPDTRCGAPRITMASAIGLVNRYCCKLPGDVFTRKAPFWSIITHNKEGDSTTEYQCSVKMPINSVIKEKIVGDRMASKKLAKMTVAMDIGILLHQKGELDENFLPVKHYVVSSDDEEEEMDCKEGKPGTKQKKKHYIKKIAPVLSGIPPQVNQKCHLYRIKTSLIKLKPSKEELNDFLKFDPAAFHRCFGILTTKQLPPLCNFTIFNKSGKVNVELEYLGHSSMTGAQEMCIKLFQAHTFSELLDLADSMMVWDPLIAGFAYFVVSLCKHEKSWKLDYKFMHEVSTSREMLISEWKKLAKERKPVKVSKEEYLDAVLKPVYQLDNPHPCYVFKIRKDMTAKTPFPKDTYDTYDHYYKEKFQMKVRDRSQPLVEVYYCDKPPLAVPNYLNRFGMARSLTNKQEKSIVLVAEFCQKLAMPGSMRRQASCLPLILHRINSLLQVDQLRMDISSETGIGKLIPITKNEPLEFDWILSDQTADLQKKCGDIMEYSQTQPEDEIDTCTMDKLKDFRSSSSNGQSVVRLDIDSSTVPICQPSLQMLLSAITALHADDFLNLERLETVGDAFLKYATSMYCYHKYPEFDEGRLTTHKMKQISNKNLCKLGKKRNIPEMMIYNKFEPSVNWRPPGFKLPQAIIDIVDELDLPTQNLMLPGTEAEIKILSSRSFQKLFEEHKNRALSSDSVLIDKFTNFSNLNKTWQPIADKNIADCCEALIGSYVISCGPHAALLFMTWLGLRVLPLREDPMDITDWAPLDGQYAEIKHIPSPLFAEARDFNNLLIGFKGLESKIEYEFKDKSFLLQAFTHSSYVGHTVTDCYQRLEFLGDAVLDYIITRHLFADPKNFGPGELSDLRQALVNNIFFGMLAVNNGFHKYIRYASPGLLKVIGDFANNVDESNGTDLLEEILIEEENCKGAEEIEVPKVLGDVVESLAGAIFLDSGMSFDTVWRVFRKLMAKELEHYRLNIPINPVRQILELFPGKGNVLFLPAAVTQSGKVNVTVEVGGLKFCGYGTNKKVAKATAAKRALKHFKSVKQN